jgi:hypothetical protein
VSTRAASPLSIYPHGGLMPTSLPSVAAIIPSYNCAGFLAAAVASVRSQTVPVQQIIIIDDGSTDDTDEVVGRLGPDICYLKQQNAGPSAARNTAAKAARTEWVAFLDADDLWFPEKNERQLALLERYPDLALIATDRKEVDAVGAVIVHSLFEHHGLQPFFDQLGGQPIPGALTRLVRKNFIPTSSVLVRRQVMMDLGGFNTDIRFSEDLELWCRIAAHYPIACLPEVQTLYRRHGANAVAKTEQMLLGLIQTMRSLREQCRDSLREGCDPDRLVAEHLATLGYFHFDQGCHKAARRIFRQSLSEKTTARALFYFISCYIPVRVVHFARSIKQALTETHRHASTR